MSRGEPIPQPGPARISKGAGPDEWLEMAKQCKYLPESEMKRLCEIVKECLMEGKYGQVFSIYNGLIAFCGRATLLNQKPNITPLPHQNQTSSPFGLLLPSAAISMASSTICLNCSALQVECLIQRMSHPRLYPLESSHPMILNHLPRLRTRSSGGI